MVFGTLIGLSGEIGRIGMKVVKAHRASVDLMEWARLTISVFLIRQGDVPENRSYICSSTSSRSLIISHLHTFLGKRDLRLKYGRYHTLLPPRHIEFPTSLRITSLDNRPFSPNSLTFIHKSNNWSRRHTQQAL
jgi:hypothetical protein